MNIKKPYKKIEHSEVSTYDSKINGSSLSGYLKGFTYTDLITCFGSPTFSWKENNVDYPKVSYEWIFEFQDCVFCLYDWKTYDPEYTENNLTVWNIGSKANSIYVKQFIKLLTAELISAKNS